MATTIHYESVDKILAEAPEGMTRFKIEKEDPSICILTLNKPETLNAFSSGYDDDNPQPGGWTIFDAYLRALTQEVKLDADVKVVVITGAGRAFSSGADIKDWRVGSDQATRLIFKSCHPNSRRFQAIEHHFHGPKWHCKEMEIPEAHSFHTRQPPHAVSPRSPASPLSRNSFL